MVSEERQYCPHDITLGTCKICYDALRAELAIYKGPRLGSAGASIKHYQEEVAALKAECERLKSANAYYVRTHKEIVEASMAAQYQIADTNHKAYAKLQAENEKLRAELVDANDVIMEQDYLIDAERAKCEDAIKLIVELKRVLEIHHALPGYSEILLLATEFLAKWGNKE